MALKKEKTVQKDLEGKKVAVPVEKTCPFLAMKCMREKCALWSVAWSKCSLALLEKLVK